MDKTNTEGNKIQCTPIGDAKIIYCQVSVNNFIYSFTFVFQGKYQKVVELWKGNMQLQFKKVEYMHE